MGAPPTVQKGPSLEFFTQALVDPRKDNVAKLIKHQKRAAAIYATLYKPKQKQKDTAALADTEAPRRTRTASQYGAAPVVIQIDPDVEAPSPKTSLPPDQLTKYKKGDIQSEKELILYFLYALEASVEAETARSRITDIINIITNNTSDRKLSAKDILKSLYHISENMTSIYDELPPLPGSIQRKDDPFNFDIFRADFVIRTYHLLIATDPTLRGTFLTLSTTKDARLLDEIGIYELASMVPKTKVSDFLALLTRVSTPKAVVKPKDASGSQITLGHYLAPTNDTLTTEQKVALKDLKFWLDKADPEGASTPPSPTGPDDDDDPLPLSKAEEARKNAQIIREATLILLAEYTTASELDKKAKAAGHSYDWKTFFPRHVETYQTHISAYTDTLLSRTFEAARFLPGTLVGDKGINLHDNTFTYYLKSSDSLSDAQKAALRNLVSRLDTVALLNTSGTKTRAMRDAKAIREATAELLQEYCAAKVNAERVGPAYDWSSFAPHVKAYQEKLVMHKSAGEKIITAACVVLGFIIGAVIGVTVGSVISAHMGFLDFGSVTIISAFASASLGVKIGLAVAGAVCGLIGMASAAWLSRDKTVKAGKHFANTVAPRPFPRPVSTLAPLPPSLSTAPAPGGTPV